MVDVMPYRYCYAATFAAQNLTASKLAEYWGIPPWAQIVFFYVIVPIILLVINLTGVFVRWCLYNMLGRVVTYNKHRHLELSRLLAAQSSW